MVWRKPAPWFAIVCGCARFFGRPAGGAPAALALARDPSQAGAKPQGHVLGREPDGEIVCDKEPRQEPRVEVGTCALKPGLLHRVMEDVRSNAVCVLAAKGGCVNQPEPPEARGARNDFWHEAILQAKLPLRRHAAGQHSVEDVLVNVEETDPPLCQRGAGLPRQLPTCR